jgi:SAM-dependent methyltransferase
VGTHPSFKEDLVAFYDAQALEREQRGLRQGRGDLRGRFLQRLHDEGRRTLIDLGSGPGHDAVAFTREGIQVTAVDLSAQHVALCQAKGIDARIGDFYTLDFPSDSFQAGWAMSSLLHVPNRDLDAVFGEITRVLCPQAPLAIGLWGGIDREGIWAGDIAEPKRFFSLRSDDHLRALLSQHHEILEFHIGSPEEGLGSKVHYQWCVVTSQSEASTAGSSKKTDRHPNHPVTCNARLNHPLKNN